jgi:hypothetical protein
MPSLKRFGSSKKKSVKPHRGLIAAYKPFNVLQFGFISGVVGLVGIVVVASSYASSSILAAGSTLPIYAQIDSPKGGIKLIFQGDGNLVLRNTQNVAIWNSGTSHKGGNRLVMQSDGNLVMYKGGTAVWNTHTARSGASRLAIQDDANMILFTSANKAVWSTNTAGLTGVTAAVSCSISGVPPKVPSGQPFTPLLSVKNNGTSSFTTNMTETFTISNASGQGRGSSGPSNVHQLIQPGSSITTVLSPTSLAWSGDDIHAAWYVTSSTPKFACAATVLRQ